MFFKHKRSNRNFLGNHCKLLSKAIFNKYMKPVCLFCNLLLHPFSSDSLDFRLPDARRSFESISVDVSRLF